MTEVTEEKNSKLNIICLSNQLWDFPNWTNKKHVMTRLAKQGHNVLFVDPPINVGRVFFRQVSRGLWSFIRILSRVKKDPTGTHVYTPLNLLPIKKVTAKLHARRLNKIASKFFDTERKTVLWIYHVEIDALEVFLNDLKYSFLVYDCVDNYESFPKYNTEEKKARVREQEKTLATKANVVFGTTPLLAEKLKKFNLNTFFTPNVGDYEKFSKVTALKDKIPERVQNISRPRVGFAGALDEYKFDFDLMQFLAEKNPEVSFILIGQLALKDKNVTLDDLGFSKYENIHLLGVVPYENLQDYYAGFDAYIIPYKLNDYTVGGCFPVKFHDALAAGLPTIVTNLPAYLPFGNVSYISKTFEEFSANLKKALHEDNKALVDERQKVASENTWDKKVETMLNLIFQYL